MSWWNKNVESRMDDFKAWIGDYNQPSKVYCRDYVVHQKYKTLIDCGCGLATDFYGFRKDGHEIEYTGLDSCTYLVELNRGQGIPMIEAELEGQLPAPDSSYDCVYCREVLEHLSHYKKTVAGLIRIGKKEVIIVFFIKPDDEEEKINYWEEEDLYHNKYNKEKLNKFILRDPKVDRIKWVDITDIPYDVKPREEPVIESDPANPPVPIPEPEKPTGEKAVLHIFLKQKK